MEYRVFYSLNGNDACETFRSRLDAHAFIEILRKTEPTFIMSQLWAERIIRTCVQISESQLMERVDPETFFA